MGTCDTLGYRILEFYVDSEGGSDRGFEILYNGVSVEQFKYGMNPYSMRVPSNDQSILFTVLDKAKPECFTRFDFYNESCDTEVPCFNNTIAGFIQTMIEFECTSDSTYLAYASFPDSTYLDSLWLSFYNQESNGAFGFEYQKLVSINDFPYLLGEFSHSNVLYYYYLTDPNNIFCYTANEWNDAPDCSDYEECFFNNIELEASACTDSGLFQLHFSFHSDTSITSGFTATVNGIAIDSFDYGQLRYTTSFLEVECDKVQTLILQDIATGCIQRFEFDAPVCCDKECKIYDIELYDFECNDDGSYSLVLDFEYQNNQNAFFDVWAGDKYVGYYAYRDLPITIDSFYSRDVEYDLIKICDNDYPDCCAVKEFLKPDCDEEAQECRIFDIYQESYDCTATGTFMMDFEFKIENPGSLGFVVSINNRVVDSLSYGQLYYTIGPLEANCDKSLVLEIIDLEYGCSSKIEFDKPECCDEDDCSIDQITVSEFECNDDGSYGLLLDFEFENNTNDYFDVWAGNTFVGYYSYHELPVWIDSFYSRDAEYDLIKICDNDNPDCCAIKEFMGPDCDGSNERCPIADLELLETVIHSEGEVLLIFDFHIDIDAPVNLDMYVNGEYYSTELNIVPPFEFRYLDGVPERMHIKMCLEDHLDCCLETVVELDQHVDCELYELNAVQTFCDDGQFYLVVDASHGFENTDYIFELRGNGMNHGHFSFDALPVAIGPFHEDQNINEIVLTVPGIDECYLASALEISCECTTSIIEIDSEEFTVSETNTELRIESNSLQSYKLELYTLDGKQVLSTQTHGSYALRKENYQTGIYILRISFRDAQKSFKIFIKN